MYRLTAWLGILAYGALVFEMARLWIAPAPDHIPRLQTLTVMIAFEFILIHASVLLAATPKLIAILVFVPAYSIFAFAMNMLAPGNTILWLYFGVVFLRIRFAFSNPTGPERDAALAMSGKAVTIYCGLMFAGIIGSGLIPKLGLTHSFLSESGYKEKVKASGLFFDSPHIPMAIGVAYFSLLAFFEIRIYGLLEGFKSRANKTPPFLKRD